MITDEPDPSAAFPVSEHFQSLGVRLGRNARMLGAQAPDRMAEWDKVRIEFQLTVRVL